MRKRNVPPRTKSDSFNSSTSFNGSPNDNEGIVEQIFKLPYRIKERYDSLKKHKKKPTKLLRRVECNGKAWIICKHQS